MTVWTVGHSNRTLEQFLAQLAAFEIGALADVRRFPGSRKHPHFNRDSLSASLAENAIVYEWFEELGGRRKPNPDSPNTAWRNDSFRGFADYMETDTFRGGVERLLALAAKKRTAIMCSEALWWRCHRSMIADYLKNRGVDVQHITSAGKSEAHPYTSAARLVDGRLSYVEEDPQARLF